MKQKYSLWKQGVFSFNGYWEFIQPHILVNFLSKLPLPAKRYQNSCPKDKDKSGDHPAKNDRVFRRGDLSSLVHFADEGEETPEEGCYRDHQGNPAKNKSALICHDQDNDQ